MAGDTAAVCDVRTAGQSVVGDKSARPCDSGRGRAGRRAGRFDVDRADCSAAKRRYRVGRRQIRNLPQRGRDRRRGGREPVARVGIEGVVCAYGRDIVRDGLAQSRAAGDARIHLQVRSRPRHFASRRRARRSRRIAQDKADRGRVGQLSPARNVAVQPR